MDEKAYKIIITDAGRASIAAALAEHKNIALAEIALGDGSTPPNAAQTALAREVWRGGISRLRIPDENATWCVAETLVPAEVGGWTARELGIYDAAGTLVAVGNIAESHKPLPTDGTAREMLVRCVIELGENVPVELVVDPTKTAATAGYVDDKINAFMLGTSQFAEDIRAAAAVINRYKYAVIDREEFDAMKAHDAENPDEEPQIRADTVYFVRGSLDISEAILSLSAKVEAITNDNSSSNASLLADIASLKTQTGAQGDAIAALAEKAAEHGTAAQSARAELEAKIAENANAADAAMNAAHALSESFSDAVERVESAASETIGAAMQDVAARIETTETNVNASLGAERAAREQSETALAENASTLAVELAAAKAEIDALKAEESPDGEAFANLLSAAIDTERTARTSADNTLSAEVDRVSRELSAAQSRLDGTVLLDVAFETTAQSEPSGSGDSANWKGYLGTLGQYVGDAGAGLLHVVEITAWRRQGSTPNAQAALYLRLHRRIGNAWVKVLQSANGIKMGQTTNANNPCAAWKMAPVAGQEANALIPADETILLTVSTGTSGVPETNFGTIADDTRAGGIAGSTALNWNVAVPAETMQSAPKLRIRFSTPATRLTLAEIIAHIKGV